LSQELKRSIIMAALMTAVVVIIGLAASHIIGLALAPEQAKLAPKQVEDNAEAYQVVRGTNIGVIRTWLFIGGCILVVFFWGVVLVRYIQAKDENEEPPQEEVIGNG